MPGSSVGSKNPVLAALQEIMVARSDETRDHCCRLADLSWRLGRRLDLSDGQLGDQPADDQMGTRGNKPASDARFSNCHGYSRFQAYCQ